MIAVPILKAIAFPWILLDENDLVISSGQGSLFKQPVALVSAAVDVLSKVGNGGWGRAEDGFAVFRFTTQAIAPYSLVLYGLKVNGISTAQGRSSSLSIRMEQDELTQYVAEYCIGVEQLDDAYRTLIRENIHEIRGINSGLYNTAYELHALLEGTSQSNVAPPRIAQSVVRWSELLRGRIDFMEFIANPTGLVRKKEEIAVYKKFDKVQRCFRVTANQRGISLSMQGSSTATVIGPPIFDIVPYLLLDNAIKYSPDGMAISVICNESLHTIFCKVTSTGPRIKDEEMAGIFSSAVRGENASKTGAGGSGFGLAVLDRIVRTVFGGTISVSQTPSPVSLNSVPYAQVSFEIQLPLHRKR